MWNSHKNNLARYRCSLLGRSTIQWLNNVFGVEISNARLSPSIRTRISKLLSTQPLFIIKENLTIYSPRCHTIKIMPSTVSIRCWWPLQNIWNCLISKKKHIKMNSAIGKCNKLWWLIIPKKKLNSGSMKLIRNGMNSSTLLKQAANNH